MICPAADHVPKHTFSLARARDRLRECDRLARLEFCPASKQDLQDLCPFVLLLNGLRRADDLANIERSNASGDARNAAHSTASRSRVGERIAQSGKDVLRGSWRSLFAGWIVSRWRCALFRSDARSCRNGGFVCCRSGHYWPRRDRSANENAGDEDPTACDEVFPKTVGRPNHDLLPLTDC